MLKFNKIQKITRSLLYMQRNNSISFQALWADVTRFDLNCSLIQRFIENSTENTRIAAVRLSNHGNTREASQLHVAVMAGDSVAIKRLLSEGKDPNQKDKSGISPIDLAKAINEEEVINVLDPSKQYKSDYSALFSKKFIIYDLNETKPIQQTNKSIELNQQFGIPILR